ncbi:hypothetical protein C8J57DRAFT_1566737 [Mycena rebaudengoi]|nr:hypothetical protein C8J57DRAFT_1566737 [Mycena rebaudengoi]
MVTISYWSWKLDAPRIRRPSLALLTRRSRTVEPLNGAPTGDKTTLMTPEKRSKKDSSKSKTKKGLMRSPHRSRPSRPGGATRTHPHTNANNSDSAGVEDYEDEDEDDIRRPSGLGRSASLRSLPSPAAHDASCSRGGRTNRHVMLPQRLACAPSARSPWRLARRQPAAFY